MRQAIDARQFVLDYQPIVHLRTNTVLGVESLVRWNHPDYGRLLPDDFIRVAEHTGLVNPLTSFVLESAMTRMAARDAPGHVRASPSTSRRGACIMSTFPGRLRDMLDAHGVPASSLALEITENLVMSDPDGSIRCLDELHDMGVRLVIDDFGKGYSSLSYLRRLPVDEIKIDRSFIIGLADGEDDTLVRCMIDLAHNLGMTVIAEGVETEDVSGTPDRAQLRRRAGLLPREAAPGQARSPNGSPPPGGLEGHASHLSQSMRTLILASEGPIRLGC